MRQMLGHGDCTFCAGHLAATTVRVGVFVPGVMDSS
jgi:hypothetical protein